MNPDQKKTKMVKDYDAPRARVMEIENSGCLCISNFDEKEGIEDTSLYGDPIYF